MSDERSSDTSDVKTISLVVIALGVVTLALVYGANFLIPIVVAFLVLNIIEAIVVRLRRIGIPNVVAVTFAVLVILAALSGIVLIVLSQLDAFINAGPQYIERFRAIGGRVAAELGERVIDRLQAEARNLNVAVYFTAMLGSAGALLFYFGLVIFYVFFLLVERGTTAERIVALGSTEVQREQVSKTLTEISEGIRQFLFVITAMSAFTGVLSYFVLSYVGLDFAEIWALLIFLLNYIPSIGSVIGVVVPAVLALVQFDSLTPVLIIALGLGGVQFILGNFVQPMMMGRSLNLSPFVVVVALTFWSTVWGIAGAFLAVPITAGIAILCREIPRLRWIAALLGQGGLKEADDVLERGNEAGSNREKLQDSDNSAERDPPA